MQTSLLNTIRYTGVEGNPDPESYKPIRASDGAVGYDVFAYRVLDRKTKKPIQDLPIDIQPGDAVLIGIGIIMALPFGYEIQVRPRSGLASKDNIELSNSPGTVDPDFRGEVGVLLRNKGKTAFTVEQKMRIAQIIPAPVECPDFLYVLTPDDLPSTRRGIGGFGSTGLTGLGIGTDDYDKEQLRIDLYQMRNVLGISKMSNCVRGCNRNQSGQFERDDEGCFIGQTRRYGCIIASGFRVIASGFNAQYPGSKLCSKTGCQREELGIASGTRSEVCRAIHAEQMAILTAANEGINVTGATMYVNAEPCLVCAKMIAGLSLRALVVLEGAYSTSEGTAIVSEAGIKIRRIPMHLLSKDPTK